MGMKRFRLLALTGFAAFAAGTASADLRLVAPAPGATVSLLTDAQKAHCDLAPDIRREKFADISYRERMGLPAETPDGEKAVRKAYWPKTVRLAWSGAAGAASVKVTDARTGAIVFEAADANDFAIVDNLEIAAAYDWTVTTGSETAMSSFRTEDRAPRLLRFPGVPNVRDLGGRIGSGGRRVRQGRVLRSAGFNENASTNATPGANHVAGANGAYILGRFDIRTDIDLRCDEEVGGMRFSPLGTTVAWRHLSSAAYGGLQGKWGREQFAQVFRVFLDERNFPIVFHCVAGQDRTGAVAFILNGLLGVSEDELALDWETTGLWNRDADFCHAKLYDALVAGFRKEHPAETLNGSIVKYVMSLGFTAEEIVNFREFMLEPDATEEQPSDDLTRLEAFIRIPSVASDLKNVSRAVRFFKGELDRDGLVCTVETMPSGREVLFASTDASKTPDVLISAHLDVVAAQTPDLYVPRRAEGRIWGRGASDCKEHCVLAGRLMRKLKGKVSVGCIFGSDEEVGGSSTAFMIGKGYVAKKLAIVLDSEQYMITTRQKGLATYNVTATEKAMHTGLVQGVTPNAARRLAQAYEAIAQEFSDYEDGSWRDVVSLANISGGRTKAKMSISVRCASPDGWAHIEKVIREKTGCEFKNTRKSEPVILDESQPYLVEFRERMRRRWPERNCDFYHLNSSTDARHVQKLGVPMLILGSDARGAHTETEHVIMTSLDEYDELLREYLLEKHPIR